MNGDTRYYTGKIIKESERKMYNALTEEIEREKPMIPSTGKYVTATRKRPSNIYDNTVSGIVLEVFSNACRVIINVGTDRETDFQFNFSDWDIEESEI